MKRLMKVVALAACVGAVFNFAGCGDNGTAKSTSGTQLIERPVTDAVADSAKDVAMNKLKAAGFDKIEFTSEKVTGDKSLVVAKVTTDGMTEEAKVYCSKVGGKWTVTKMD